MDPEEAKKSGLTTPGPNGDQPHNGNAPPGAMGPFDNAGIGNGLNFNPSALPVHIQEQLRRQMAQQQQQMGGMMHRPMPMGMPGGMMRPGMVPGMMSALPGAGQNPMMHGMVPGMMAQHGQMSSGYAQPQHLQAPSPMAPPQQGAQQPRKVTLPPARLAALAQVRPIYSPGMDESSFVHSLSQFLSCVGIPLRKPPIVLGRPLNLHQLFVTVTTFGGYARVCEGRRWPAIAASIGLPPSNPEGLTTLHSVYVTLLLPYEQYMVHRIPAESISWPAAVMQMSERLTGQPMQQLQPPTQAQTPMTQQRLATTSTAPRPTAPAPLKQQSTSTPPGSSSVIDMVPLTQWKHVNTIRDSFLVLHRGRHSFREIVLLLESGKSHLTRHALNQLQVLLLEPGCPSPDPLSVTKIVDILFRSQCEYLKDTRSLYSLSREQSQKHQQINSEPDMRLLELISSIFRALSGRSDVRGALHSTFGSQREHLNGLVDWALSASSLEVRKNALLVLSELPPSLLAHCDANRILEATQGELEELETLLLASSHRLMLSWEHVPGESETLKKTIVNMIPASTNIFRTVPALTFVRLELLHRLLLQHALAERRPAALQSAISRLLPVLLRLYGLFLQPMSKLCLLIGSLLRDEEFLVSAEYSKWVQKILHSASFGLPDGGFMELILLCMDSAVTCLEPAGDDSTISSLVPLLLQTVSGLRRLWEVPEMTAPMRFERQVHVNHPGAGTRNQQATQTIFTERSPLQWQACGASTSQPYQVLLLALRLLGRLTDMQPKAVRECLQGRLALLASWQAGEGLGARLSREILLGPELQELYARLLLCAL